MMRISGNKEKGEKKNIFFNYLYTADRFEAIWFVYHFFKYFFLVTFF